MALPNTNITPGAPPLLWSDVNEAFRQVNENFDTIQGTLELAGLSPIDFKTLDTDVIPTSTNTYKLGSITNQWKSLHTAEWGSVAGSELNGLWAGSAQIKGVGLTVNLPENSTIGGDPATGVGVNLIIDPNKTFFKSVQVDNGNQVVANSFADTLNLNSGTAIQLVVDSSAESITVSNIGVTSLINGSGIEVSSATGEITVTNTGVRSLTNVSSLPSGRTLGSGINIDSATGDNIKITNTGVLEVQSGFGITVSTDNSTGVATVSFNPSAAPSTAFTRFHITGDFTANDILSDTTADTFNITQGYGILLSNNPSTDTLTITLDQNVDISGSIFGDDSTKIVDAVENKVYATGGFYGNLVGNVTGNITGNVVGNTTGYHTGDSKGSIFADDSTLLVDAVAGRIVAPVFANVTGNLTGNADSATVSSTINVTNTNGLTTVYYPTFVENRTTGQTLRGDVDLTYRTDTNTLTAGTFSGAFNGPLTGNIFTNLIDSADSSQIKITPLTLFESDAVVENDLIVKNLLTALSLSTTSLSTTSLVSTNATISSTLSVNGNTLSKAVQSAVTTINAATGVVVHNYAAGSTFRHTAPATNFTVNLTNMNLNDGFITQVRLIIVQGITPRVPSGVQISGVSQTLLWKDNLLPIGNAGKRDVVVFTISNIGGSYIVLGELSTYG